MNDNKKQKDVMFEFAKGMAGGVGGFVALSAGFAFATFLCVATINIFIAFMPASLIAVIAAIGFGVWSSVQDA